VLSVSSGLSSVTCIRNKQTHIKSKRMHTTMNNLHPGNKP
jgi:hypothetical protein